MSKKYKRLKKLYKDLDWHCNNLWDIVAEADTARFKLEERIVKLKQRFDGLSDWLGLCGERLEVLEKANQERVARLEAFDVTAANALLELRKHIEDLEKAKPDGICMVAATYDFLDNPRQSTKQDAEPPKGTLQHAAWADDPRSFVKQTIEYVNEPTNHLSPERFTREMHRQPDFGDE